MIKLKRIWTNLFYARFMESMENQGAIFKLL